MQWNDKVLKRPTALHFLVLVPQSTDLNYYNMPLRGCNRNYKSCEGESLDLDYKAIGRRVKIARIKADIITGAVGQGRGYLSLEQ